MAIKLNLGCGSVIMAGYTNHDVAIDGVDLRTLEDYENNSVDEIQCHHAIEHIGRHEVIPTLKRWYMVLKSGGKVVVTCPDIIACMKKFIDLPDNSRWYGLALDRAIWGEQDAEHEYHKTGFSLEHLKEVLETAGFEIVAEECIEFDHGAPGLRVEAKKP